jgi:hypothetical protein
MEALRTLDGVWTLSSFEEPVLAGAGVVVGGGSVVGVVRVDAVAAGVVVALVVVVAVTAGVCGVLVGNIPPLNVTVLK